jgi:serine kinase of HPr protein (carbohydrate metabolism regulator)
MTGVLRQASCVLINGCAVLIEGPPGCGKSSLALALIDRGAVLVGDDGVLLEQRGAQLWASPPPNITGLLELRNLGLVELPVGQGPVGLLLRLDHAAPRFIDAAEHETICGVAVPYIALYPDTPALPLRAEWAVRKYAMQP